MPDDERWRRKVDNTIDPGQFAGRESRPLLILGRAGNTHAMSTLARDLSHERSCLATAE